MEFKEFIEELKQAGGIKEIIAQDLEEYKDKDDAIGYLKDVTKYGGQSGSISGLIYYTDTNKFYDENEKEIEDILEEYKENCGFKSRPEAIMNLNGSAEDMTQEKNLLAWMAYEEVARLILEEMENLD